MPISAPVLSNDPRVSSAFRPRALAMVALGLSAALSNAAWAQSLPELYEAARGYGRSSPTWAARAQAESAKFKAAQSGALVLPNVSMTAGASQTEANGPRPPSGANRTDGLSTLQASVQARQSLFNRSNSVTIEQAKRSIEVASADLETAEQDLIVRVAQAYFDVLAAQDSLTTAQTNKRAISEQLASAKRNFEVGTATITDTREAQARFDLAGAQELAAENDLQTKRVALDVLVGRNNVNRSLATPVVLPPVAPADINAWVSAGDEQHPSVRKARLGLEVAKLETEKSRAADSFTVDLSGAVKGARNTGGLAAPLPGNTVTASVGIELNMPLYTGGLDQNRIKESLALEEKSRNDFDAARRGVAQGRESASLR